MSTTYSILKLSGGLLLTTITIGILIYLVLRSEARHHRIQKELALSQQAHKNRQYVRNFGMANVETLRKEK